MSISVMVDFILILLIFYVKHDIFLYHDNEEKWSFGLIDCLKIQKLKLMLYK